MIRTWVPTPTDNESDESGYVLKSGEFGFCDGALYEGDGITPLESLSPLSLGGVTNNGDGTATA